MLTPKQQDYLLDQILGGGSVADVDDIASQIGTVDVTRSTSQRVASKAKKRLKGARQIIDKKTFALEYSISLWKTQSSVIKKRKRVTRANPLNSLNTPGINTASPLLHCAQPKRLRKHKRN